MDYRNIVRGLVLNKALKRFTKRNYSLKMTELYILLAVAFGNDSALTVRSYLIDYYRTYPLSMITGTLARFVDLGLVVRSGVKYKITFTGESALKEVEQYLKDIRRDK
jgi:hypothetical protein